MGRRNGSLSQEQVMQNAEKVVENRTMLDLKGGRYMVESKARPRRFYDVTVLEGEWKCTCSYHIHGKGRHCKHIVAIQEWVASFVKRGPKQTGDLVISDPDVVCTRCNESNARFVESRTNKYGMSERYWCRVCEKKFTHRPGLLGCHYPDEVVIGALICVAHKMSNAEAAGCVSHPDGRCPDEATVGRWVKKFSRLLKALSDMVAGGRTGLRWAADERFIRIASPGKSWLFGVMDIENRFLIDYDFSGTKFGYDATNLFKSAIGIAGRAPVFLTTDSLPGFVSGIKGVSRDLYCRILHIKDAAINKIHSNNNIYERLNGTLKDMLEPAHGFCSKQPATVELRIAHYNLFRPHMALGNRSPAENMGLVIKTKTGSMVEKWLVAIRHAALFCT